MFNVKTLRLVQRYQDYLQFRRQYRHLMSLEDRLLEDMGLSREIVRLQARKLYLRGRD